MIRPAIKEDAPQICALEKQCIECPWPLEEIEKAVENPDYLFLVSEGLFAVVGYGSLRIAGNEAEINNIAVAEHFRRRGVAEELLNSLIGQARKKGVDVFFLEVAPENTAAAALYEKNGFVKIAARKNYYGEGKDALIMRLI